MIHVFVLDCFFFFFVKQKTAYELRISDWSSDVCSSDLGSKPPATVNSRLPSMVTGRWRFACHPQLPSRRLCSSSIAINTAHRSHPRSCNWHSACCHICATCTPCNNICNRWRGWRPDGISCGSVSGCRSAEHTSELQSLMRISYAVFCLKTKTLKNTSNVFHRYQTIDQA